MLNPQREGNAMKMIERLAAWTTLLEQGLEVTLFAAATLVVASGTFVVLLGPARALA
jgi:hypothetical protein